MTPRPMSRDEVRALDVHAADDLGIPTLILMENAGRGAAERLADRLEPGARVTIACGAGNNGGDGGVVARHLDARGFRVRVAWFAPREKVRGDAAVQWDILHRSGIDQADWSGDRPPEALDALFADADWLVDGLLGTGLARPVEGPLRAAVEALNRSGKPILALDLPSGLDADSGRPLGVAVRARLTVTFAAPKLGFTQPGAADYTGEVLVADIGLPAQSLQPPQS